MKNLYFSFLVALMVLIGYTANAQDTIAPTALCRDVTVYLDSLGNASITAADVDSGSYDNIGIDTMYLSQYDFDCNQIWITIPITLYVKDASGNIDSCSSVVTRRDTVPPVITCRDTTMYLRSTGYVATNYQTLLGVPAIDACTGVVSISDLSGSISFRIPPPLPGMSFGCDNIGMNNVIMTADDGRGNTSSCLMVVTIIDTFLAPITNCRSPITRYLNSSGYVDIYPYHLYSGASCVTDTITISQTHFTCADVGVNDVVVTAYDSLGNFTTCTTQVTIVDTFITPTGCQDLVLYLDSGGLATITPYDILTGNPCGYNSIEIDHSTFTCNEVGANVVNLITTDTLGNVDTCVSSVTVFDTIAPMAICNDTTLYLDESGDASIVELLLIPYIHDNCAISQITLQISQGFRPLACPPPPMPGPPESFFDCEDIGVTEYLYTMTDPSGNLASCTATITVLDTTPPELICENVDMYLQQSIWNGNMYIWGTDYYLDYAVAAIDNCDGPWVNPYIIDIRSSVPPPLPPPDYVFTCNDYGTNEVLVGVDDSYGNTSTCTSIVNVLDTFPPTIVMPPNDTLTFCIGDTNGVIVNYQEPEAFDACGVDSFQQIDGLPNGFLFPMGVTVNVFRAIDSHGNDISDTLVIKVTSGDAPSADFSYNGNGCVGSEYEFEAHYVDTSFHCMWYFGDYTNPAQGINTTHIYQNEGAYNVTLHVTDETGCMSSASETIYLLPQPSLAVDATDASCHNTPDATVTALASGTQALLYSIDGHPATAHNIFYNVSAGSHNVVVTDGNGCTNNVNVFIGHGGVEGYYFDALTRPDCETSANGSLTVVAFGGTPPYFYSINNGGNHASGTFNYLTGGEHTITVTDSTGCQYSGTFTLVADQPMPVAGFDFTSTSPNYSFDNSSLEATQYQWSFGDGSTSTQENPGHSYMNNGAYLVTLIASNECGADTISQWVQVTGVGINDLNEELLIDISPNPNDGSFSLQLDAANALNDIEMRIWSVEGKLVSERQLNASGKTYRGNFNYPLASGVYTLELLVDDMSYHKRLVIK